MFRRIVVAYDESEPARAALRFAFRLAERADCELTVAHALTVPAQTGADVTGFDAAHDEAKQEWERRLAGALEEAPGDVRVQGAVCEGGGAAALLDLLERVGADLVVAGTHGVGGLKRFLLGSFSQRLLEHAPCSVLLFRGPLAAGAPMNILVGLDGSGPSRRALGIAEGFAAALSARLILVYVADYHLPFAGGGPYLAVRDAIRRYGASVLADAHRTLAAPLVAVDEELREGTAREQLIAACEEHRPAIAVVGSRGEGGFRGLLLGSTARDLVTYGPCPVLVVRDASSDEPRTADERTP